MARTIGNANFSLYFVLDTRHNFPNFDWGAAGSNYKHSEIITSRFKMSRTYIILLVNCIVMWNMLNTAELRNVQWQSARCLIRTITSRDYSLYFEYSCVVFRWVFRGAVVCRIRRRTGVAPVSSRLGASSMQPAACYPTKNITMSGLGGFTEIIIIILLYFIFYKVYCA